MARSRPSTLRTYLDETGGLPPDVLLGHIVMFTVFDAEYDRNDVTRWFDDLSLNPDFVPEPNRAIDAYRKATSAADDFEYTLSNGLTAHVLVRDVASDKERIVRHLVREVRDDKRQRLAFAKIGEAIFYRSVLRAGKAIPGTERFRLTVDHASLLPGEREAMQEPLVGRITAAYDRHVSFMDGMKVRAMIRDYIRSLNAVSLKAGIYFVHITRKDELDRLSTLVERLGNGCFMHLVPLVNLEEQREQIVRAHQEEAERGLSEIVAKIQHIRTSRKSVTPEAYAKVKREYDEVISRATEYTRLLGVSQDRTAGAAEVALDALVALQGQMLNG